MSEKWKRQRRLVFVVVWLLLNHSYVSAQTASSAGFKEVKIYFTRTMWDYNPKNPSNLYPVKRRVRAKSLLRSTLKAWTNGPTQAEEKRGYHDSTYGIKLVSVAIKRGVAYTYFTAEQGGSFPGENAPFHFTNAVEKTAKQFPGIRKVFVCLDGVLNFWSENPDEPAEECPKP